MSRELARESFLVEVPATSANMGPGFDSLGLALDLFNCFFFRPIPNSFGEVTLHSDLSLDRKPKQNLVYRAYLYTLEEYFQEEEIPSVEILAFTDIPSARGLGSSATAIIAGVMAAGFILKAKLSFSEIIKIATRIEGHPDNVSAALLGGMVISCENREKIYSQKIDWPTEICALAAIPDLRLRTSEARKVLPQVVKLKEASFNISHTALLVSSIQKKDWIGVKVSLEDHLHQKYRASLVPGFNQIVSANRHTGVLGTILSGSGPTILVLALRSEKRSIERAEEQIKEIWRKHRIKSKIFRLKVQRERTRIKRVSQTEFEDARKELLESKENKV